MKISETQTNSMTRAGLNLIAQALSIYDSDLRLAVCNAPFQQMFDLPDRLVTQGAPFEETIRHLAESGEYGTVEDVESFVQERVTQARTFKPHYMERTRANGRTISVEGSPLPQGGWVTVYTDITAVKDQQALLRARSDALNEQLLDHAERLAQTNRAHAAMITTLEETKRQLTESEARTRLTTEMMPAHIAHLDANGYYTYSNRRLSSVIPGRPSNIVSRHVSEALGAENHIRISPALAQAYAGTATVIEFTDNDSARRIRAAFTPDTRGGVYVLSMDITEETQTRVALQQTRKRELAAQTISGLAHDFSNLLTIILGLQSKLGRLDGLPEGAPDLIEGTLAAARRGGHLLSAIADVTGPRTLRPAVTDLAALLEEVDTLAAPALPKGVAFSTHNEAGATHALVDKGKIIDSLLNLILNARDACGNTGQISLIQRMVHDTWIEWTLRDSGAGFSAEALKHAFDPFFTTKGSEGSGLGLSMVYDMSKSAGGDLRVENHPQGGALVRLRLPFRPVIPETTGLVLLVEDDDALRKNLRDQLVGLGHSVIEATSADEASALLADLPDIALILSDIQLKGEATGLDLLARTGGATPVVLMTALPSDHPLHRAAAEKVQLLHKPFTTAQLAEVLSPQAEAAE